MEGMEEPTPTAPDNPGAGVATVVVMLLGVIGGCLVYMAYHHGISQNALMCAMIVGMLVALAVCGYFALWVVRWSGRLNRARRYQRYDD